MFSEYTTRGVAAGLVAGIVFGAFVAVVGDPLVALAEELAHAHEHGHGHQEPALFTTAASVGGGIVWGLLGGLALGVGYYFLEPVLPGSPDAQSYLLAVSGFITASGAPWLVLPPRPAGVEQALQTDVRLFWYGMMMVAGAMACGLALLTYRHAERTGTPTAVALFPFGLLLVPALLAPSNPVGATTEGLVATYRGVVVMGQLLFWGVIANIHSWLCRRSTESTDGRPVTASPEPPFADC